MRLQDMVVEASDVWIQTSDTKIHNMPGANTATQNISSAPLRYVLDDACVRMVSEAAFGEKSMVGEAVDLLRMPAERIWLEWSEPLPLQVVQRSGHDGSGRKDRPARKVGILIESDDSGRRGAAQMIWQNEQGEAELSPFVAEFDFDAELFRASETTKETVRHVQVRGLQALDPFFRRIRYRMDPKWEAYYRGYCKSNEHFERIVCSALTHVAGDFPIAAAFFLILSTRSAFDEKPASFAKLNAKRARKGKTALLDFVEVKMNLTPSQQTGGFGAGERSLPRLHHVSGHLVRRGDTLYWRRAHLRGNPSHGAIVAKTINVTASPIEKAA